MCKYLEFVIVEMLTIAGLMEQELRTHVYRLRRWTFSVRKTLPTSICVILRKPKCMLMSCDKLPTRTVSEGLNEALTAGLVV